MRATARGTRALKSLKGPSESSTLPEPRGGTPLKIGGKVVNVTNPQKVLYADGGFTKSDVIGYYLRIADTILPHLKGRTVTLKRYPNGAAGEFFYEKNCPVYRPPWVNTARIPSRHRAEGINYCLIESAAALAWVANLASIELHTSLARASNVNRPTMLAFDLDPGPPADIIDCAHIALRMRDVLERLGLKSFPKTSGGKGLHFYVPLNTPCTFEETKEFARAVATLFEREDPQHVTASMKKELRPKKVFIDWSQNDEHKTTVCAYSLRARQRPTVSTPVTWREVEVAFDRRDPSLLSFEADDVTERVSRGGDHFAPVLTLKQKLPRF